MIRNIDCDERLCHPKKIMFRLWSDNPRKAGKEFLLHSFLFGSIIFLITVLVGRVSSASYLKELFGLWLLCIVGFGPLAWAIVGIVRDATKW